MKVMGTIESLWRYPVKSMGGEALTQAFVGFPGFYGDRLHAFRSSKAPKGFPWLTGREQPGMLLYRARYRYPGRTMEPVNLAEAQAIGTGLTPVYADLSEFLVDVETPGGGCLAISDPRLMSLLRQGMGDRHELTLLRSHRCMTDCRPISMVSLQTVRQLSNELGFDLDKRRFRANLYLDLHAGNGFSEDGLVGRILRIGSHVEIRVLQRDSRCKMLTLDPGTAEANPEVMKLLVREHEGKAGVYGAVLSEGIIRPGDRIALLN